MIDGLQENGLVYRYDSKNDKLVLCKLTDNSNGYLQFGSNKKLHSVHRAVYETFVGEIPFGYHIDHINTIRDDNRVENLRAVTQKENNNNQLTRKHNSEAQKGKKLSSEHKRKIGEAKIGNTNNRGKTCSEFGKKFKEHFGITRYGNITLYEKERSWYRTHNKKCRWEN